MTTKRSNNIEFIEKAKKIHNEKYDYSKVEYINNKTKVCIICPEHGEFWQTPNSHLKGRDGVKLLYFKYGKINTGNFPYDVIFDENELLSKLKSGI